MSERPDTGLTRRAFLKLAGLAAAIVAAVAAPIRQIWAGTPAKSNSVSRPEPPAAETSTESKRGMWQRFTERARRVVFFAQEEAARLGLNYVGNEHLLLGLVRENDSVAARILDRLGVAPGRIRSEIERQVTRGQGNLGQDMQLTPRAKRVIDLAYEEARQLNNNYIGTEHLLLGILAEQEGLGAKVLRALGGDLKRARAVLVEMQSGKIGAP